MKKPFTLIFSLLSVIAIAQNQNNIDGKNATCGFDAIQEFLRKSDISYAEKIKALNKSFAENASATTTIYTIPIVVHVFHVGEAIGVGSNVSEAAVNTMIENMNQQFRAQGSYNVGNDTRIQFALAKRTPNCQVTNGIVRIDGRSIPGYETNGINYQDLSAVYPLLPQASKWPEGDYINFYVVHKITGGAAAFAWWGGDLVFGYQYLGAASHEMGHFLGMAHTFNGSSGDECPANANPDVDGDAVNDTDPHSYNSNNCAFINNNNPCTGQIYGNVLKNFMSYACGDRFSPRQIQKMRTWLETDRLSLTTSLGGSPPTANSTPVAACSPTFVNNFTTAYPWGIDKFTLSNLVYTSSNSSEGKYLDLTCSRQVTLQRGNTYPVEINTGFNLNNVRIYLDANNNGVFTDSELLYSSLNQTIHTGSVQMPTGALLNTPLRLRVAADVASAYGGTPPTACQMTGHPTYGVGQYEDYTVFLTCANAPTISGVNVTQPTCASNTGIIVVTASGSSTLEYSRNNGSTWQTSNTFSGLAANSSHTIKARLQSSPSCETAYTANAVVINPIPNAPVITSNTPFLCSLENVTFTATGVPANTPMQWQRNGIDIQGATATTYSPPIGFGAAGVYSVRTGSCSSNIITIEPNAIVGTSNPSRCEGQNVIIEILNYFEFTNPPIWTRNGTPIQGAFGATYTTSQAGIYSALVNSMCPSTFVEITPKPATPTASVTVQPSCSTSTGTIVVTAPTGANLQYSVNGSTYQSSPTFSGLTPNTYSVTVKNTLSNCISNALSLTVNAVPTAPATPTASVTVQPSCSVSTGTIVVTAPTGANLQYSVNGSTYQSSPTFSGLTPGNYSVTVKNTLSNCISNGLSLTVNTASAPPVITTNTMQLCGGGGQNVTFTAAGVPANTPLQWQRNGIDIQGATGTTYSPPLFGFGAAGGFRVRSGTCTSNTLTIIPFVTITTSTANLCEGQSVTFEILNYFEFIEINSVPFWTRNGIPIDGAFGPTYTTSQAGQYSVIVPNNFNCPVPIIEITPKPATPTASVTVQPSCSTSTGTIVVTAPTGANLQYSVNGSTYQTGTTFSGLTPGNYSVTVKNTVSNCISNALSLTVNAVPTAPATPTASVTVQPSCSVSTGTIVVTAPTGANLQYNINGGTYQTSTTFAALAAGTYLVRARNTTTGCVSNPLTLTVNTAPATPIITANTTNLCEGQNVTFTATGIPTNTPMQWQRNDINIQGATSNTYTPPFGMPGNYKIVTAACTSNVISIYPNQLITANTPNLCEGQNITFSIVNFHYFLEMGMNPIWLRNGVPIPDAFGPNYTTSQTGIYSIMSGSPINGGVPNTCFSTFFEITPKPATPTASVTVQPSCSTSTGTIVVTAPTGANLQYSVNGSTYQTGTTFSGLTPGNYSVTVKNTLSNCVSNALSLTVNTVPTAPVITANTPFLCSLENVTFTVTGVPANTPLQWQRNGLDIQGATTTTYTTFGTAGNYSLRTTSCNSNILTIEPSVILVTSNPSRCEGQNVTLEIPNYFEFSTPPIWTRNGVPINGAFGPTYTTSQAGTYSVIVINSNCFAPVIEIVPKPATPTASVTVQPNCTTPTGTIVVTAPTGANLQYSINGNTYQSSPTFSGLTPGNYSVTVKNTLSNCTSNGLSLTVNAASETCGTLTITPSKVFVCPNTPTTLVASGCAGTVTWTGGTTGNSLTISASTTTTYTATCAGGESSSITVNVASTTANLTVLDNINTGTQLFQTTQRINAANTIGSNVINPKPTVTYQAGQSVLLQPGFSTVNGTVFKAEIKGCSN